MSEPRAFFLYVSRLAPGLSPSVVGVITRQAREHNAIAGITGLLIFDGETFAQYIEGPSDAIARLRARIERDSRHRGVVALTTGSDTGDRRFPDWGLGYLMADVCDGALDRLASLRGQDAMTAFTALVPNLDISVGSALPA